MVIVGALIWERNSDACRPRSHLGGASSIWRCGLKESGVEETKLSKGRRRGSNRVCLRIKCGLAWCRARSCSRRRCAIDFRNYRAGARILAICRQCRSAGCWRIGYWRSGRQKHSRGKRVKCWNKSCGLCPERYCVRLGGIQIRPHDGFSRMDSNDSWQEAHDCSVLQTATGRDDFADASRHCMIVILLVPPSFAFNISAIVVRQNRFCFVPRLVIIKPLTVDECSVGGIIREDMN